MNNDTKTYIDTQLALINVLQELLDNNATRDNLMTSETALGMANNELKTECCLEFLAKYPQKIKVSAEELEIVTTNIETILKLTNEIKDQQRELLLREFTIWDILINLNDDVIIRQELEA